MVQEPVRIISERQVRECLTVERSIELGRAAMTAIADGSALDSSLGHLDAPDGEFHLKASGLHVEDRLYVCVKIGACFYGRPAQLGLPSIVGLVQLFDGATGQPLAIMESGRVTALLGPDRCGEEGVRATATEGLELLDTMRRAALASITG